MIQFTVSSVRPNISFKKVLVMDDDPVMRTLFGTMLKPLGYDTVCVRAGADAIRVYETADMTIRAFLLIILDLHNRIGLGVKPQLPNFAISILRYKPSPVAVTRGLQSGDTAKSLSLLRPLRSPSVS